MEKWKSENWWVSKYNYMEEFTNECALPKKIEIHDATLRDGEQTPGVVLSIDDKVEIAKMLDQLGVERIEAGMPVVSADDREAIKRIIAENLNAKIFSFARATVEDIDIAKECGVDGVIIEIPTSEPKLEFQFPNWSEEDIISRSVETVKYAKSLGLETVYFGYDTTRANYEFLQRLYSEVIEKGKPDSIGIVDTMGSLLPGAAKALITKLKSQFDIKIEIHAHNDFGLGVATSFAAVEAGAEVIHTCLNGLGERTGNAPLEAIMVGLKVLYGVDVDYKFEIIRDVSNRVAELTNFPMPVNKPIVGDNIFVRESGIGIDLVMNTPLAMYALNPHFIGHKPGVVLGKKSGTKSVTVRLEEMNLTLDDNKVDDVLQEIKQQSISLKRTITNEEFRIIVEKHQ